MLQGQKSEEALEDKSQWENHRKDDEAGSWAYWGRQAYCTVEKISTNATNVK